MSILPRIKILLAAGLAVAYAACTSATTGGEKPRDAAAEQKTTGGEKPDDAAAAQIDDGSDGTPREAGPADLFVSGTDGTVTLWRSDGTLLRTLDSTIKGPAFGMAYDAASTMYVTHGYTEDLKAGNAIETFNAAGERVGTFGGGYDCNPHSIVFDDQKRAYVGQEDCKADILQFDETGGPLASFDVATEVRGALWIALADDQCTVFYTSMGPNVKRYNVCTLTQLPDFNKASLPVDVNQGSGANDIKLIHGGGLLVANFTEIVRLDKDGIQTAVYDKAGPDGWRGLDLDVDGASFWVVNYSTSDVVRFDIESGDILDEFNTGAPPLTLKGVLVKRTS
jgi:hypothetical protein